MIEQMFGITTDTSVSLGTAMISMLFAVVLGIVLSVVYLTVTKRANRSQSFFLSLIMLPAIVAVVIVLVSSNVARAISIAGVFSLVRFRSAPGDSKDISLVFLAMTAGLSAGLGYLTVALVLTLVFSVIIVLCSRAGGRLLRDEYLQLRVLIPEDMDYQGVFDDLFAAYTKKASLDRIKTTNMGTLYELTYHVNMKEEGREKEFLDAIRCRNGNLTVLLSRQEPQQGQQL